MWQQETGVSWSVMVTSLTTADYILCGGVYIGDTEYVEWCVKGVFVEISSQRSIAQIFLTNYR